MASLKRKLYNLALSVSCLAWSFGCQGKPKEPPPGAPDDVAPPTVEQGTDSNSSTDSTSTPDSSEASGKPSDEKGDK
jgi:hypothetical protein